MNNATIDGPAALGGRRGYGGITGRVLLGDRGMCLARPISMEYKILLD